MSLTGQLGSHDSDVREYGYALGPPTGILVLHHRTAARIHFAEERDDYRHRLFWSADGVLAARRGSGTTHLGPHDAFWVRRGTAVEVTTCGRQSVHLVCLRQAPPLLAEVPAAAVPINRELADTVRGLCRSGVSDDDAMAAKERLLAGLGRAVPLLPGGGGRGLARQVAAGLLADPGAPSDLVGWARRLHTTTKTLQRDFLREYGVPWSVWRTRTRLQASTALLGRASVTQVAHRVGYASASAYVDAFRREYGITPGQWARGQTVSLESSG
ncbi:AraC family transcriptional regulator [Nocardioides soli]|uniref:AraC-like DNA-binding protein n=1 Tax=Nocardioides soli TaxID=1036020 RepID=A0A7W4Z356_9ACTN|nr:helix-turn-helix domain-containing protein [Nocardioides soli]MBB3045154.1 AraC-like DNA-binding protein [Nocardioides soli]